MRFNPTLHCFIAATFALFANVGCAKTPAVAPHMTLGGMSQILVHPNVRDWMSDRIAGKALQAERAEHMRHVQSLAAPTGWSASGVSVSSMGGGATDYIPNGPAEVFVGSMAPAAIQGKGFFLTKAGTLIRVAAGSDPTVSTNRATLALGKTFTKTNVTLSPSGSRAYCLSDDGTFFIVDTVNMAIFSQTSLGSGLSCQGLSPVYDPIFSNADDSREMLYVPTSDGKVHQFTVFANGAGATPSTTTGSTWSIASGSSSVKLSATPIAYWGKLYVADQSGNLIVFDATTGSASATYALGATGISASPALDTNSSGTPTSCFVNVGATCAWIDLVGGNTYFSRPLFMDDSGMSLPNSGYLLNYRPNTMAYYYLSLQDNVTMNVSSGYPNLNTLSSYMEHSDLSPADSYVTSNTPTGTSSIAYLRFSNADGNVPSTYTIADMQLLMKPDQSLRCPPPEVADTSEFLSGGSTLWTNGNMTSGNRPTVNQQVGSYVGSLVGGSAHANATYTSGSYSRWDLSNYVSTPQSNYAYALVNNSGGNAAFPYSSVGATNGNSSGLHRAPKFQRGTVTGTNQYAGPQASVPAATGPLLEILASTSKRTYPSIQTAPIIDSARDVVYVVDTNALYVLDYSAVINFEDTDVSTTTGTQTDHTVFCLGRMGQASNGSTYGTTYSSGDVYFVQNTTSPALGYDGNEIYLLDRYPSAVSGATDLPTTYTYALTKIGITSFSAGSFSGSNFAISNYLQFANVTASEEACQNMSIDLFTNNSVGDHVNFSIPGSSTSNPGLAFIVSP